MKNKNPRYSIRAWAKTLRLSSSATLFRVLKNERRIPSVLFESICDNLKLNRFEKAYFELILHGDERMTSESFNLLREGIVSLEKVSEPKDPLPESSAPDKVTDNSRPTN